MQILPAFAFIHFSWLETRAKTEGLFSLQFLVGTHDVTPITIFSLPLTIKGPPESPMQVPL